MTKATEEEIKAGAGLALGLANILAPGSGTAIQLAPIVIAGVFDLYDRIVAAKPSDVTIEEWRARLTDDALRKSTDDYLNEARKLIASRKVATDVPPA